MSPITISVIGMGYCGNAFLYHLLKLLTSKNIHPPIHLLLFEKRNTWGDGISYNVSLENVWLNTDPTYTTIDYQQPHHFQHWIKSKNKHPQLYEHRSLFGQYLIETLQETIKELKKRGIQIEKIKTEITNIQPYKKKYQLISNKGTFTSDIVLLTSGINEHRNIYQLHADKYINDLYHQPHIIKKIKPSEKVLILGMGSSCFDAIELLHKQQHTNGIWVYSRTGRISTIKRKKTTPIQRNIFDELIVKKGLSARAITSLFKKYIQFLEKEYQCNIANSCPIFSTEDIAKELKSKETDILQRAFTGNTQKIEQIFQQLSDADKVFIFKNYYGPLKNQIIHHIKPTYKTVYSLLKKKQLIAIPNAITHINKTKNTFEIICKDSKDIIEVDWVINATGPSFDIHLHAFYHQLLKNKIIAQNAVGGIRINPDTHRCIDKNNKAIHHIYAITPATTGIHLLPYAAITLSAHAEKATIAIIEDILLTHK